MPMDFNLPGNLWQFGWNQSGGINGAGGTQNISNAQLIQDQLSVVNASLDSGALNDLLPSNPQLPPVSPYANSNGLHAFVSPGIKLSNLPAFPTVEPPSGPQVTYDKAVVVQLNALTPGQLAAIAPGLSHDQAIAEIQFAMAHPNASVPPSVRSIANTIVANATTDAKTEWGAANFQPDLGTGLFDESVKLTGYTLFQAAVGSSGLPQQQQSQLTFAFQHPSAVASLPPNLRAIYDNIQSEVQQKLTTQFGLPSGWTIGNYSQSADNAMNLEYDTAFEAKVSEMVANGEITADQGAEMVTLHYNPNAQVPNKSALLPTFDKINQAVLGQMQQEWGFPAGWTPEPNSGVYNQILDAGYNQEFNANLNAYTPPLTSEQKSAIRAANGDPALVAQLSPELQAAYESVRSASIAAIQNLFGLPLNWQPTAGQVTDPSAQSWGAVIAQNAINQGNEIVSNALGYINSMSPGAAQTDLLEFMKLVSSALATLQRAIYSIDISDANAQARLTKIQTDAQLSQIAEQKKKLEEIKKKEKKMKALGPLMDVMKWLVVAVLAATPGCQLILAAMFTNLMVQNKGNLGKTLGNPDIMSAMMKTVQGIGCKGLTATFGIAMMMTPVGITDLMFGNGTVLTDTLTAMGVPKNIAGYISMGASVVAQLAVEILMEIFTAGAATEVVVGMVLMKVAQTVCRGLAKVAEFAVTGLEILMKSLERVSQVLSGATEMLVKLLKKVIKLLEELDGKLIKGMEEASNLRGTLKSAKASLESNQNALKSAQKALRAAEKSGDQAAIQAEKKAVAAFKSAVQQSEKKVKEITKALGEIFPMMNASTSDPVQLMMNLQLPIQFVFSAIQTGININNDVLLGEVAMLKAELSAYQEVLGQFKQEIGQLINEVLDNLSSTGQWIQSVSGQEQKFWQGAVQVMTGLAAA